MDVLVYWRLGIAVSYLLVLLIWRLPAGFLIGLFRYFWGSSFLLRFVLLVKYLAHEAKMMLREGIGEVVYQDSVDSRLLSSLNLALPEFNPTMRIRILIWLNIIHQFSEWCFMLTRNSLSHLNHLILGWESFFLKYPCPLPIQWQLYGIYGIPKYTNIKILLYSCWLIDWDRGLWIWIFTIILYLQFMISHYKKTNILTLLSDECNLVIFHDNRIHLAVGTKGLG